MSCSKARYIDNDQVLDVGNTIMLVHICLANEKYMVIGKNQDTNHLLLLYPTSPTIDEHAINNIRGVFCKARCP